MGTLTLTIKRPDEATPERALALYRAGVRPVEMARMWGISRQYVYYLLHRAGWKAPKMKQEENDGKAA